MTKKDCSNLQKCHFQKTLNILWGKWKIIILWMLKDQKLRPSEMQKKIVEITQKMLIQQLRELESDELVQRKVFPVVPPRVEYSLTEKWEKIIPVLKMLDDWGEKNIK